MRRFILIAIASIIGSIGLMAFYVMWDYDPDTVSPMVSAPSYMGLFQDAVKRRMGKQYEGLDEAARARVLGDLIASREANPVREVALFRSRELANKDASLALIRKNLDLLPDDLYETAIGSVAALGTPKGAALLDTLYRRLDADPASHTPLGGYRSSTLLVSRADADLAMTFQERSRGDADFTQAQAREISLFFPADPEYLIAVPNVDDVLKDFNGSRFAQALDKSPVPADIWTLPMLRTIASLRSRLGETMGFLAPYFSPEKLFRDHLAIGKYGEEYLIVTYKDKNVSLGESMIDVFGKLGKDFGISNWQVDATPVGTVRNRKSGKTMSYATSGEYFIVATDTALIGRALATFQSDRGGSIGIDPLFNAAFAGLDQSGQRDQMLVWMNPTEYFAVTGSKSPAARRLAMVARALGRPVATADGTGAAAIAGGFPSTLASATLGGDDPMRLWRYMVDVRSLGKNPIDSLARLAKIDIGKQIVPYLAPSMAVGYSGVEFLRQPYGYSNTAFNTVAGFPLRSAPARFDSTLGVLFGRITSLIYTPETLPGGTTRLWIASDTTTNDTLLKERKLQPSFAVIDGRTLLIASTPTLLRKSAASIAASAGGQTADPNAYFTGTMRVDSFTVNTLQYMKSYLSRGDRFTQADIASRFDPLRSALGSYDRLNWIFTVDNGLRRGTATLVARR